jgi:hypothetical protein
VPDAGILDFEYLGAEVDRAAATPTVLLRLRITESSGTPVHAIALRTQVRVEPHRRRYDDDEAAALVDLFGSRGRWGQTLKPLQLAFVSHLVPSFVGSIETSLALPCSYDFDVAANKYLYSLVEGVTPLLLLFSGTWFSGTSGALTVLPIPWDKEVSAGLPVDVWRAAMDQHFPGTAWLRLGRDAFDALYRYRADNAMVSWDEAVTRLLKEADG